MPNLKTMGKDKETSLFFPLLCAALTGLLTRNSKFQELTPLAISWRPFGAPEVVLGQRFGT